MNRSSRGILGATMRVLHYTDVHLPMPLSLISLRELWGKRILGAANTWLRRQRKFGSAVEKLQRLDQFRREQAIDLVLFTGDYTVLGTEAEYTAARVAVSPLMGAPFGYVHVPGNHDLYLPDTVEARRFERTFAGTFATDLPEFCVDGPWPLVRLVKDEVAVVAVNSARPNPQMWRSSGRIPPAQLAVLPRILADERVINRFVFIITHYGVRRASGRPDDSLHGLENADELLVASSAFRRGALLHGHIHHCFHLQVEGIHVFSAGSTTYEGREGLWVFDINGAEVTATRGRYDGRQYVLDHSAVYEL